ncbi:PREDICTED: probable malate dehydrogenase, glyoxysomal [Papilio polytes]|uniref:probable malate dehydrogenase, glyoxysomal n=1 Tax=Papilio polytes TaxID=76194 RepID=UPI00067622D5|nr:PREDICTED: probable malate dehydrogenase, glyoxysomal [Papilio polytes]
MFTSNLISRSKYLFGSFINRHDTNLFRYYAKFKDDNKDCRKAIVDIPPKKDEVCPGPCERRKKKKGILHRIKLKIIEGGTNFGTPFRELRCEKTKKEGKEETAPQIVPEGQKALPAPVREPLPLPAPRPGVQVSVLGAETTVGQYTALLLKQCPCIKKLRLYEARCPLPNCDRDLCQVVDDLQHINTNCHIQAFSCSCCDLERCLQNTDLVLVMDGACSTDSYEKRFTDQAAMVKRYADVIANECPKAFIIVGATPIDCMVPLMAKALSDMGWYSPRRLLGSLAVPEMRASTLAARALCLDPSYCKVPCVGGTEGDALVPLFSKAVEYFDFTRHNAEMLTETVRSSPAAVTRSDGDCLRAAELSEAHALAGLVSKVANALICADIPHVTGYCQMNPGQVICSSRFIANLVEINGSGITKNFGLPQLSDTEITLMNVAMNELCYKERLVCEWYNKYCSSSCRLEASQLHFFTPKHYERFDDCAYANM